MHKLPKMDFLLKLLVLNILIVCNAYPHGENIPGPHQGFIRMPGGFHTELLVTANNVIWVYLLDVEFKDPVVKSSSVAGVYKNKAKEVKFECSPEQDRFRCDLAKELDLTVGEINLKTKRLGMPAGLAVYKLPLTRPMAKSNPVHP